MYPIKNLMQSYNKFLNPPNHYPKYFPSWKIIFFQLGNKKQALAHSHLQESVAHRDSKDAQDTENH